MEKLWTRTVTWLMLLIGRRVGSRAGLDVGLDTAGGPLRRDQRLGVIAAAASSPGGLAPELGAMREVALKPTGVQMIN